MRFESRRPSESVHQNALTEKAWENAVHRPDNTCIRMYKACNRCGFFLYPYKIQPSSKV